MPRTIRFHLDEHCDPAIAAGLRLHGVDVTTTPEARLLGAEDEEHIAYCMTTGRVVFTQDQDFLRLHATNIEHPGGLRSATRKAVASVKSSQVCCSSGRFTSPRRWRIASSSSSAPTFKQQEKVSVPLLVTHLRANAGLTA